MKIRRTLNIGLVRELDALMFPGEDGVGERLLKQASWWLAWLDGRPVGYGGVHLTKKGNAVLTRAGVVPMARGRGIQGSLIRARLRWARARGAPSVTTYTAIWNRASANNLIAHGFRLVGSLGGEYLLWRKML